MANNYCQKCYTGSLLDTTFVKDRNWALVNLLLLYSSHKLARVGSFSWGWHRMWRG